MSKWKLPPTCRIGYKTYKLASWPRSEGDVAGALGVHEFYTETIRVRDDLSPNQAAETLLHELLHACWRNVSLTGDVEENAVSVLSANMAQVWRDNPAVIKWISEQLKG